MGYLNDSRFGDGEQRIVTVTEVNPINHRVIVQDSYGTLLYVTLHLQNTIVTMPVIGEKWIAERQGIDWFLEKRAESGNETTPLTGMSAGDKRIETTGTLFLNAPAIILSGAATVDQVSTPIVVTDLIQFNGGGQLYVEKGALKYRGTSGTVTTIAPA